jgi:hypothetical protein
MTTTQLEQANRDIAAALADLRGRRDQALADLDERIAQLELLQQQLDQGAADPRQAQERVRRLIGERSANPASRIMRAGRTQIGMRMSGEHTPVGPTPSTVGVRVLGPSSAMAGAALNRAISSVDQRIVTVLSGAIPRDEARLELAVLRRARRSVDEHLSSVPEDVVLLSTLMEHADDVLAIVADLDHGGQARVKRLLDYDRELISQVTALGGNPAGMKEAVQRARQLIETGPESVPRATAEAIAVFTRVTHELTRRAPSPSTTILDELVRV